MLENARLEDDGSVPLLPLPATEDYVISECNAARLTGNIRKAGY